MPVAIPTWRNVELMPARHPGALRRHDPHGRLGEAGVHHPDAGAGERRSPGSSAVHFESASIPLISSSPSATSAMPMPNSERAPAPCG